MLAINLAAFSKSTQIISGSQRLNKTFGNSNFKTHVVTPLVELLPHLSFDWAGFQWGSNELWQREGRGLEQRLGRFNEGAWKTKYVLDIHCCSSRLIDGLVLMSLTMY